MTAPLEQTDATAITLTPTVARTRHPIARMIIVRILLGLGTLAAVSVIVFAATQILPGNAALAVAGKTGSAGKRGRRLFKLP